MISKRSFLTGAASAAAIACSPAGLAWAGAGVMPFDLVVFNERYSDARIFAQALGAHAVAMLPIGGDAGTLWYGTLAKRIAAGEGRVAGMGTPTDLFILETLGRQEAKLRVRFVAHHDCRGRSTLTHSIYADGRARHVGRAVGRAGAEWPSALAAALSHPADSTARPQTPGQIPAAHVLPARHLGRSDDHPGMLVSWILT